MIAFGKFLFHFIKVLLLWLLSLLATFWKLTGIRSFSLEWSRYGLCLSLYTKNTYAIHIYSWNSFTLHWTQVDLKAEYSTSINFMARMPKWRWDVRRTHSWRCRRCNNVNFDDYQPIPADGICDTCIKAVIVSNYNNGKVAETA